MLKLFDTCLVNNSLGSTYKTVYRFLLIICTLTAFSNIVHGQEKLPETLALKANHLWESRFTTKSGSISFTTSLNQNDNLVLVFSNHKKLSLSYDLIRVTSSDQDCIGNHETSVAFRESRKNFVTRYFTERTPWKRDIHFSVTWAEDNHFTIKINNEEIPVKTLRKPKYIYILSNQSIQLNKFTITE